MHILWILIIGLVAGALAKLVVPGKDGGGIIITMVLGVIGAFVANLIGHAAGFYRAEESAGLIASVIGAVAVLAVYHAVSHRKTLP